MTADREELEGKLKSALEKQKDLETALALNSKRPEPKAQTTEFRAKRNDKREDAQSSASISSTSSSLEMKAATPKSKHTCINWL